MPVSLPVDAVTMNYASVVFAGFAAIAIIWYLAYARKNFTGPPIHDDDGFVPGVEVLKGQEGTSPAHKDTIDVPEKDSN